MIEIPKFYDFEVEISGTISIIDEGEQYFHLREKAIKEAYKIGKPLNKLVVVLKEKKI